jgi:hypothetical protein
MTEAITLVSGPCASQQCHFAWHRLKAMRLNLLNMFSSAPDWSSFERGQVFAEDPHFVLNIQLVSDFTV